MDETIYFSCSGGGTKALMFCGVLDALEDYMQLNGKNYNEWRRELKGLAGTSAGTICCLCILLGLNKQQRENTIKEIFSDLRNIVPCPDISLMINSFGLENGKTFRNHIKKILSLSGLSEETTLGDIKRLFAKDFYCICSNLQTQRPIYISSIDTPSVKIYDAIYMSCSIPFVFAPMEYEGNYVVDGSLTEDIPFVFDNEKTMFLYIPKITTEKKISSWLDFINCLLHFSISSQKNEEKITEGFKIKVLGNTFIRNLPSFDFNLNEQVINEMISYGYMIVMNMFTNYKISESVGDLVCKISVMHTDETFDA
jgi:predicted acylesterase/phospholipase RssA